MARCAVSMNQILGPARLCYFFWLIILFSYSTKCIYYSKKKRVIISNKNQTSKIKSVLFDVAILKMFENSFCCMQQRMAELIKPFCMHTFNQ